MLALNTRSFSTVASTSATISKVKLVSPSFESLCDITDFIAVTLTNLPDGVSHVGYLVLIEHTAKVSKRAPADEPCHGVAERLIVHLFL